MPKRYFITNTHTTDLPLDFINSKDKKHIHVISVRLIDSTSGALIMNTSMHSDFIIDHPDLNGFVCIANDLISKRKKWEILHRPTRVNLHFEDFDGTTINPSTYKFIAEFLLEW